MAEFTLLLKNRLYHYLDFRSEIILLANIQDTRLTDYRLINNNTQFKFLPIEDNGNHTYTIKTRRLLRVCT